MLFLILCELFKVSIKSYITTRLSFQNRIRLIDFNLNIPVSWKKPLPKVHQTTFLISKVDPITSVSSILLILLVFWRFCLKSSNRHINCFNNPKPYKIVNLSIKIGLGKNALDYRGRDSFSIFLPVNSLYMYNSQSGG
jgi:hypothetical protein